MTIELIAVAGLPEVRPGDDLGGLIAAAAQVRDGDVVVVAQKVISKAEGRLRSLASVTPSAQAEQLARRLNADARQVQIVLDESVRIVRDERALIVETRQGYVCANAGVDHSNIEAADTVTLLPEDPDRSAAELRDRLGARAGVIVSDTFGRPWRLGIVNVALGVAGLPGVHDLRGTPDDFGRDLQATVVAEADELAAAAGLVMRKTARVPVVIVRGWTSDAPLGSGHDLVRPAAEDLFR